MRYFKFKGEKAVFPAEENTAGLYLRNGFTECDEKGKALPEKADEGDGAEQEQ